MPDILGATNPVPGYDKANINRNTAVSPEKVQIRNSPDLSRVSRADGKTERQDSNLQGEGKIRYDSNFHTFMQRLQTTPGLTETLSRILTLKGGIVVRSGLQEGVSEEMAQLMSMLQMDRQQLLEFLTGQMKSGSRLNGALFSLLRNAYANAASTAVQEDILQFLKQYLDYVSMQHIEGNILRNLAMISDAMPASRADRLRELLSQLSNGILAGDQNGNLLLLQREIIPYISKYIEQTHDMGLPRELTTMLALNVARYENGTQENMLSAFHRLASYGTLKSVLGQIDDNGLLEILRRNQADAQSEAIRFADRLTALAAKGMRGSGGADVQQAYQDLIHALLINESVYMPLNHYLLPLRWESRMLFSEMWVDPDAEQNAPGRERKNQAVRVLIKMDVQGLGLFDIVLQSRENVIDLQISHPASISTFSEQIEEAATHILTQHGLRPGTVTVRKMERPVTLTEVFPRIFEGMNSINVKI